MSKSNTNLIFCLAVVTLFGLGCGIIKNPFRDYSEKSFNSAEWRAGGAVERGRMYLDLFKSRSLEGKSPDEVLKMLGEPDKKQTVEGREVWLYYVEHKFQTPMKYFPVSFDATRGTFAGRINGDTISLLVEE